MRIRIAPVERPAPTDAISPLSKILLDRLTRPIGHGLPSRHDRVVKPVPGIFPPGPGLQILHEKPSARSEDMAKRPQERPLTRGPQMVQEVNAENAIKAFSLEGVPRIPAEEPHILSVSDGARRHADSSFVQIDTRHGAPGPRQGQRIGHEAVPAPKIQDTPGLRKGPEDLPEGEHDLSEPHEGPDSKGGPTIPRERVANRAADARVCPKRFIPTHFPPFAAAVVGPHAVCRSRQPRPDRSRISHPVPRNI